MYRFGRFRQEDWYEEGILMRRLITNALSVIHSFFRLSCLKLIRGKQLIVCGMQRLSPNVVFEMNPGAKVTLGKTVRIHSGSKIKVRKGAELSIGDNVKMNYYCVLVCHHHISIGEGTEFGPFVLVYDHDHDFRAGLDSGGFRESPVSIGKNCWIGSNVVILRGATIGDNCVIGAGSVVTGDVPSNTVLTQKRDTIIREWHP